MRPSTARSRGLAFLALLLPLVAGCALIRRGERPPFKKLSPSIAYEMMRDSPEMLILDLRTAAEFNGETGHLRRAQNIPLERLPFRLLEISPYRDSTLLVYCRADVCGEQGMSVLVASGFENAVLMDGGIDAWIREGFKTVLPDELANRPSPRDGRGPVMPLKPGELEVAPRQEVPVEPPPPPPPPPPPTAAEWLRFSRALPDGAVCPSKPHPLSPSP